jgi:hypothetical protein
MIPKAHHDTIGIPPVTRPTRREVQTVSSTANAAPSKPPAMAKTGIRVSGGWSASRCRGSDDLTVIAELGTPCVQARAARCGFASSVENSELGIGYLL